MAAGRSSGERSLTGSSPTSTTTKSENPEAPNFSGTISGIRDSAITDAEVEQRGVRCSEIGEEQGEGEQVGVLGCGYLKGKVGGESVNLERALGISAVSEMTGRVLTLWEKLVV